MCRPINIAAAMSILSFSLVSSAFGQMRIPYRHKMLMLPVINLDKRGTGGQGLADIARETAIQVFNQRKTDDAYRFTVPAFTEVQRVSKEANISLVGNLRDSVAACARLMDCDWAIYEQLAYVRVVRGPLGGIQSVSAGVKIALRYLPSGYLVAGAAEVGESTGDERLPTMADAVRDATQKCVQAIQAYRQPEGTFTQGIGHSRTIEIGKRDGVERNMVFGVFRNDEFVAEIKVKDVADKWSSFEAVKNIKGLAPSDTVIATYADRGVSYACTPRRKRRPPKVDVWY